MFCITGKYVSIHFIKYHIGPWLNVIITLNVITSYRIHNLVELNKRNLLYFPNRVPSAKKQNPFEKLIKGGDKVVLLIGSPHPVHIKSVTNFRLKKRKRKNVYTPFEGGWWWPLDARGCIFLVVPSLSRTVRCTKGSLLRVVN